MNMTAYILYQLIRIDTATVVIAYTWNGNSDEPYGSVFLELNLLDPLNPKSVQTNEWKKYFILLSVGGLSVGDLYWTQFHKVHMCFSFRCMQQPAFIITLIWKMEYDLATILIGIVLNEYHPVGSAQNNINEKINRAKPNGCRNSFRILHPYFHCSYCCCWSFGIMLSIAVRCIGFTLFSACMAPLPYHNVKSMEIMLLAGSDVVDTIGPSISKSSSS